MFSEMSTLHKGSVEICIWTSVWFWTVQRPALVACLASSSQRSWVSEILCWRLKLFHDNRNPEKHFWSVQPPQADDRTFNPCSPSVGMFLREKVENIFFWSLLGVQDTGTCEHACAAMWRIEEAALRQ